jgi:hypothetical protein
MFEAAADDIDAPAGHRSPAHDPAN